MKYVYLPTKENVILIKGCDPKTNMPPCALVQFPDGKRTWVLSKNLMLIKD